MPAATPCGAGAHHNHTRANTPRRETDTACLSGRGKEAFFHGALLLRVCIKSNTKLKIVFLRRSIKGTILQTNVTGDFNKR